MGLLRIYKYQVGNVHWRPDEDRIVDLGGQKVQVTNTTDEILEVGTAVALMNDHRDYTADIVCWSIAMDGLDTALNDLGI